jgi:hypothetical protein
LHLLGHARRKAVGLAAQQLGPSAAAVVEAAGVTLVGHSRLTAALALDGGEPRARARALGLGQEAVARWPRWRAPQQTLATAHPPLQEGMETSTQILPQDTEPDPGGTGRATSQAARHAGPAPLERGSSQAPWPQKPCENLYRLPGALGGRCGEPSHPGGGGAPGP